MAKTLGKGQGIPRTLNMARKLGHKKANIKFENLSADIKNNFMQLREEGARAGSLCGVAPNWLVCYKDSSGKCNWVQVPRTAVQSHN